MASSRGNGNCSVNVAQHDDDADDGLHGLLAASPQADDRRTIKSGNFVGRFYRPE